MLTNLDRKIITRICEKKLFAAATAKIMATLEDDRTYENLGRVKQMAYEVYNDFVEFSEFLENLENKPKKHEDTIRLVDNFYAMKKLQKNENN